MTPGAPNHTTNEKETMAGKGGVLPRVLKGNPQQYHVGGGKGKKETLRVRHVGFETRNVPNEATPNRQ